MIFLGVFFFYPVANIVFNSFNRGSSGLYDTLASQRVRSAIWFTTWQAALSTVVTVVIAMPCAPLMARTVGRAGTWLKALVTVPFVLPTVVVGGAFKKNFFERIHGSLGLPNLNQTAAAIIVAHAFFNFAVVARTVSAYWSGLDHARLEEQARTLGDSSRRVFWRVTTPRLNQRFLLPARSLSSIRSLPFGVILILGGLRASNYRN